MHANRPMAMLLPAPSFAKPDIVRRFLAFAQCAGPEKRAEAASALARAYLHSDLAEPMRAEAELAMTALLDDPFPLVRRALADALGSAGAAPRPLIRALAFDQPDVAAAVLARSPVLTDADLVDCVAAADVVAQSALARRPDLKPGAIAALAETAQREALLALIGNREAALAAGALTRIFARFGADPEVREALLERPALPPGLRAQIAAATAKDLSAAASQWLPRDRAERVAREARDQAICSIASACPEGDRADLVRSLRACGALTPALLLRSLLGGDRELFEGALAELSGLPMSRVAAFCLAPRGEGFAALAHKAGLNGHLMPAFARRARRAQNLRRRARRRAQAAAGGDSHRRMRTAPRSGAGQSHGAALALRRRGGEVGGRRLRSRRDCGGSPRRAAAESRLLSRQRRHRAEPISGDAFDRPRLGPAQLELSAATSNPAGDAAPRVELPLARIAAVHDAA